jgi:hypothetical protein
LAERLLTNEFGREIPMEFRAKSAHNQFGGTTYDVIPTHLPTVDLDSVLEDIVKQMTELAGHDIGEPKAITLMIQGKEWSVHFDCNFIA